MNFIPHLIAVILTGFCLTHASPTEPSCEDMSINCNNPLHDTLEEEGFNILREETLSIHCNNILEDIACKKDYLSRCNPEVYKTFSLSTDGIVDVLTELCNDTSDLRKVYRKHSHCIANTSDAYQECILHTAESVADQVSNTDEQDFYEEDVTFDDVMIQRLCLFYHPFKECVTQETSKSCGQSAAQFVEDTIIRMANAAVRAKCLNRTK